MWGQQPWLSEMLKMSVKTSVSSTAQSLSTRPGMLSGPELCVHWSCWGISSRGPGTASLPGRREEVESSVQWCCFVPQSEQRRHSARSAGGWCCHRSVVGLIVRNGLYSLPQAPSVSAVAETMGYPPGVLSLASLMPRDRLALAVFRPSSSPALKAAFRAFRSL